MGRKLHVWMFLMDSEIYVCGKGWTETEATERALDYFRELPSTCEKFDDPEATCTEEKPCEWCECDRAQVHEIAKQMAKFRRFRRDDMWFHLFSVSVPQEPAP